MIKAKSVKIGQKIVSPGSPAYIIAEIGSNHDQDLQRALDMISMAAEAGVDAVKFQSIRFDRLYDPGNESAQFREWFRQIELDEKWYPSLSERAKSTGVDFLSSPTYLESIDLLVACGVPAIKLASPQVQGNLRLVRQAAKFGLPLILSMGYSEYADIVNAINACRAEGNDELLVLHCVSKYPAAPADARLSFMRTLSSMTGCPAGFSDHTLGTHMAVAAVALGACIVEKHVTLDRKSRGPDHHFALTFSELGVMVKQIREVEEALGDGTRINLLPEEIEFREKVKLKAISVRPISAGESIQEDSIIFVRSNHEGLSTTDLGDLKRYYARNHIPSGKLISWLDIQLL